MNKIIDRIISKLICFCKGHLKCYNSTIGYNDPKNVSIDFTYCTRCNKQWKIK